MSTSYDAHMKAIEDSLAYAVEGAVLEFTEDICKLMVEENVSNAELARRIRTSPAYITKVLRGNANFTLETMIKFCKALDVELHITLRPAKSTTTEYGDIATTREVAIGAPGDTLTSLSPEDFNEFILIQ